MKRWNKHNYSEEEKLIFSDSVQGYMLRLKRDPTGRKDWRELLSEIKKTTHTNTARQTRKIKKDFAGYRRKSRHRERDIH